MLLALFINISWVVKFGTRVSMITVVKFLCVSGEILIALRLFESVPAKLRQIYEIRFSENALNYIFFY